MKTNQETILAGLVLVLLSASSASALVLDKVQEVVDAEVVDCANGSGYGTEKGECLIYCFDGTGLESMMRTNNGDPDELIQADIECGSVAETNACPNTNENSCSTGRHITSIDGDGKCSGKVVNKWNDWTGWDLNCVASGEKADDDEQSDEEGSGISLPPMRGDGEPITCRDMTAQELGPGDAFWLARVEGTRDNHTLSGIFMNSSGCYEFQPLLAVDPAGILLQI